MEELTASLACSFSVTHHPNNPAAPHPRFSQYKNRGNIPDQQDRRQRILKQQKEKRFNFVNHVRHLAENTWEDEEEEDEDEEDEEEEEMDTQAAIKKPGRFYKNQLMLSEWMVEVPEDLDDMWLLVPCPVGKRCLVVSSKGQTRAYARNGYRLMSFPSHLPGGCRKQEGWYKDNNYTVLDCVYSELDKTFYILDIMSWRSHSIYDSETEFRFYWLQTKLEEVPELGKELRTNPYRFVSLPSFSCQRSSIENVLKQPLNLQLDGLLFYHKNTHYTFGPTPLVVWLKAFMLPEVLGVPVPSGLMTSKPDAYTDFDSHIKLVKKNKEMREQQRQTASVSGGLDEKKDSTRVDSENQMEVIDSKGEANSESTENDSATKGKKKRRSRGKKKNANQAMDVAAEEDENEDEGTDEDHLEIETETT